MNDYWGRTLTRRISRRRTLAASGGMALGAAFLAACGGSDNNSSSSGNGGASGSSAASSSGAGSNASGTTSSGASNSGATSPLLAKVQDTTAQAKNGGTWVNPLPSENFLNMDPYGVAIGSAQAPWGYSRLVLYRPNAYPNTPQGEVDPDGAESWEMSPDGLTFTFKLRNNLKLDPRPPTNGRLLNAQDVIFSANKFHATGVSRGEFFNDLSANSPVAAVTAPDDKTVVVKLAFPMANQISRFAFQRYMWMMPVEADGKFDPKAEMRGTGAWRLEKWETSQSVNYVRNDTWHLKPTYFDRMEMPIISEYAQRRAQLLTGAIGAFPPGSGTIPSEDILPTKKEQPKLNLYQDSFPDARPSMISFGFQDGSPFQDVRVRRAMSMLIDRDTFIDVFYNVSAFEKQGLPVEARWHTHFAAGEPPYWVDPKGTGLGEGAAYFQLNPSEAKKLMQAAGFNQPLAFPAHVSSADSANLQRQEQTLQQMIQDGNMFAMTLDSVPTNEFNSKYFNGGGLYDGIVLNQGPGVSGDIDNQLTVRFNVKANPPQCLLRTAFPWYQKTESLIEAQRVELDNTKRLGILSDLQKEMAVQMPAVPWPGIANGFSLAWPFVGNFDAFTAKSTITAPTETWPGLWYDASKA
ncbi:MAG TPA: ABC transporter substrate-binding protein [Dehalococcoidia bacterium]|nr:ABC transporter substrate-binding protein [Dehalococcoidia bacterium]